MQEWTSRFDTHEGRALPPHTAYRHPDEGTVGTGIRGDASELWGTGRHFSSFRIPLTPPHATHSIVPWCATSSLEQALPFLWVFPLSSPFFLCTPVARIQGGGCCRGSATLPHRVPLTKKRKWPFRQCSCAGSGPPFILGQLPPRVWGLMVFASSHTVPVVDGMRLRTAGTCLYTWAESEEGSDSIRKTDIVSPCLLQGYASNSLPDSTTLSFWIPTDAASPPPTASEDSNGEPRTTYRSCSPCH